ncbi:hypothetical protein BC826DRAFT_1008328, partial [Russula brevipes]
MSISVTFVHCADRRSRIQSAAVTMVADGVVDLLHSASGNRISNHPKIVFAITAFLMVVGGIIYTLYAYLSLDGRSLLLICGGIVIVVALKLRASLHSAPILATVQPSGSA